jgi:hypothetical protein
VFRDVGEFILLPRTRMQTDVEADAVLRAQPSTLRIGAWQGIKACHFARPNGSHAAMALHGTR